MVLLGIIRTATCIDVSTGSACAEGPRRRAGWTKITELFDRQFVTVGRRCCVKARLRFHRVDPTFRLMALDAGRMI
jgi:hypothetical protein